MALLQLTTEIDPQDSRYAIIVFNGELDSSRLHDAEKALSSFIETFKGSHLIFDWHELAYINSDSIGMVMVTHTRLTKRGIHLMVIGARPNIEDISEAIGLTKIIPFFADKAAALDSMTA
ncbi:hypothetical protein CO046_00475 [Candidatus Peregrinibacteria bacterium CG_4_9_14_0_2_um_filter_53_11]|nr:MAG: hypothetical protein CO046_00475 [Candidatus Peregrinibacteria bacterium CG_4_9_14_0_2_um_filter_53_11]